MQRISKMPPVTRRALRFLNWLLNAMKKSKVLLNTDALKCYECHKFLVLPVTGPCGHTRCTGCTLRRKFCKCGIPAPEELCVNKMIVEILKFIRCHCRSESPISEEEEDYYFGHMSSVQMMHCNTSIECHCIFMSLNSRYIYAKQLWTKRQYINAMMNFAYVAATNSRISSRAKIQLKQLISFVLKIYPVRIIMKKIHGMLLELECPTWPIKGYLECVYCLNYFRDPVTTPCGHTFCKICLHKSMDYMKYCPLCKRSLSSQVVQELGVNVFVTETMLFVDVKGPHTPITDDMIPIIECVLPMPTVAYSFIIVNPKYRILVRWILKSKKKFIGVLHSSQTRNNIFDFGTIVEVRDVVQFEDGHFILATIGVCRFHIVERYNIDWMDMAKVQIVTDVHKDEDAFNLRNLAIETYSLGELWFRRLKPETLDDIVYCFGMLPPIDICDPIEFFKMHDGPNWLWWLLLVIPVSPNVKILAFSSNNLVKRMKFVKLLIANILKAEAERLQ